MMTSYQQLTRKYLMANKKRTVFTIIGIILSVALISSIGLFFKGIQITQIKDIKRNRGSYHVLFKKADEALISKIQSNPKVAKSGVLAKGEEIQVEKLHIEEVVVTDDALELLPYRIKEGEFPQKENEIAIEKWALKKMAPQAQIGDQLEVKDHKYVLSGILENHVYNQIKQKVLLLSKADKISQGDKILVVEISARTDLKTAIEELKQLVPKDQVGVNTILLAAQGVVDRHSGMFGLYIVIGIILGIVFMATIAVIYNAFQISVVERIKQFGLLRAVGMTPKQIRKIVLREATLLILIGVPVGLLGGVIAIYGISTTFYLIGGDTVEFFEPCVSPMILVGSGVIGVVAIYVSAMIPAFFAGRISPLVAISSRNSIRKEKIKRRKSMFASKFFGFEGGLAAKNMKRNKKRYRITVFSIVISVVLFISFKSFMDMAMILSTEVNESKDIHFSIVRNKEADSENVMIKPKMIEKIRSIQAVKKMYQMYDATYFNAMIRSSSQIKELQAIPNVYSNVNYDGEQKTEIRSSIMIYDKASLEATKKYIEEGTIDIGAMNEENGVIIINKNQLYNENTQKKYYGPLANLKVGDEIYLEYDKIRAKIPKNKKKNISKVKVMAITSVDPFRYRGDERGLKMITTKEMAKRLVSIEGYDPQPKALNIIIRSVKNEDIVRDQIEGIIISNDSLDIINHIDDNRTQKTVALMIQILLYGFVVVISLIGSVNIINTLTTNIILRRKEFAALKSIGLTQKGLKKMIVLEGLFYGMMGTIYGSIIGSLLAYAIYNNMIGVGEMAWKIPWEAIGTAGFFALAIGYLSVLAPLARMKNENLIEAIREE